MNKKVEISHRTIIFVFVFIGALWFIFQVRSILFLLFISIILMSALNPAIDRLQRLKLPRWLGIVIIYALIVGIISTAVAGIVQPLIEQTSNLLSHLSSLSPSVKFVNLDASAITSQISQLGKIPANLVKFTAGVFSNVVFVLTLAVLTFYLLLERKNLDKYLVELFGEGQEKRAAGIIDQIENQLGNWVRGELILMSSIGLLAFIGLSILGIPYALPLAILAGILEVVPTFGPIISAVPGVLAGFLVSPLSALVVAFMYLGIQQAENTFLVPKIMQRATGVNPLISLISLMVGFNLGGPGGAILAIPVLLVAKIFISEFSSHKQSSE